MKGPTFNFCLRAPKEVNTVLIHSKSSHTNPVRFFLLAKHITMHWLLSISPWLHGWIGFEWNVCHIIGAASSNSLNAMMNRHVVSGNILRHHHSFLRYDAGASKTLKYNVRRVNFLSAIYPENEIHNALNSTSLRLFWLYLPCTTQSLWFFFLLLLWFRWGINSLIVHYAVSVGVVCRMFRRHNFFPPQKQFNSFATMHSLPSKRVLPLNQRNCAEVVPNIDIY